MPTAILPSAILVLDWGGTFVFALSGGLLGVRKGFDLFGVLFLSFVVAVAGGMLRDVLIGAVPPAAISDIQYFLIAIGAGLITFFWHSGIATLHRQVLLLDAVGLGLFAVTGAQKALAHGIHPLMAAVLGMLTGIGGGMTRDILAGEVPFVLKSDLYAFAALAGAAVVSVGFVTDTPPLYTMVGGAGLCIFLRLMAIYRGWRAPLPRGGSGRENPD